MEMKCEICNKTYLRPSKFKKHKLRHTELTCNLCGIFKLNTKELEKHKEAKHTRKALLSCKSCDFNTKKKGWLKRHEIVEHAMPKSKKQINAHKRNPVRIKKESEDLEG